MKSEWEQNPDILGDIRYAVSRMRKNTEIKIPKRIECTEKIYFRIASDMEFKRHAFSDLIYPLGDPLVLLFIQTEFSKWNKEDLKRGYKIIW